MRQAPNIVHAEHVAWRRAFISGVVIGLFSSQFVRAVCSFFLVGDVIGVGPAGIGHRADLAVRAGNAEEALIWANRLIAAEPESPDGYAIRGRAQELNGRFSLALADYSLAIAYALDPARFYADRASVLRKLGQEYEAAQDYARLTVHLAESPAPIERTLELYLSRDATLHRPGVSSSLTLLQLLESFDVDVQQSAEVAKAINILTTLNPEGWAAPGSGGAENGTGAKKPPE